MFIKATGIDIVNIILIVIIIIVLLIITVFFFTHCSIQEDTSSIQEEDNKGKSYVRMALTLLVKAATSRIPSPSEAPSCTADLSSTGKQSSHSFMPQDESSLKQQGTAAATAPAAHATALCPCY